MGLKHIHGELRLTPAAPIHIGSGEVDTTLDYAIRQGRFCVKDIEAFFEAHPGETEYLLDAVEHGIPLEEAFIRYELPYYGERKPQPPEGMSGGAPAGKSRTHQTGDGGRGFHTPFAELLGGEPEAPPSQGKTPKSAEKPTPAASPGAVLDDVRCFIKDGFGYPYIPGSSLKGVIRTALARRACALEKPNPGDLFSKVQTSSGRKPKAEWASAQLNKEWFGNPQDDPLKALVLRDSAPMNVEPGFAMTHVKIMSQYPAGFQEKRGGAIYTESLMPEAGAIALRFYIDAGRLETETRTGAKQRIASLLSDRQAFEDLLRDFSQTLLQDEAEFYRGRASAAAAFIEGLQQDGGVYLPIAFGTGWSAKTLGGLIPGEDLKQLRAMFRLGRRGVALFPKTRKWAATAQGYRPMGWCRFDIHWR